MWDEWKQVRELVAACDDVSMQVAGWRWRVAMELVVDGAGRTSRSATESLV